MNQLIFATGNPNKVLEVNDMLKETSFDVISMKEFGHTDELPETQGTIQGNAIQKAQALYELFKIDCFSEDTGLEVDALEGAPGVDTAFYGGPEKDSHKNMARLLTDLKDKTDRKAQFRTVIALILDGKLHTFEGICRGSITEQRIGDDGFGYDPVFQPQGFNTTFAEMDRKTKNKISHRGKAVQQLIAFLKKQ